MTTYFDIIPDDITKLILIRVNINDIKDMYQLFSKIIDDPNFWFNKIKRDFPLANLKLLPGYIYDYKGLPLINRIFQYKKLNEAYSSSINPLKDQAMEMKYYFSEEGQTVIKSLDRYLIQYSHLAYSIRSVNNLNVITSLNMISEDYLNLLGRVSANDYVSIFLYEDGGCVIGIGYAIEYAKCNMSRYEAFNVLLHLYINGAVEK